MQYAVNIPDLAAYHNDIGIQILLAPFAKSRQIVNCEPGHVDGGALLLDCEEQQAAAICKILRMKYPKHKLRCYQQKKKAWTRL